LTADRPYRPAMPIKEALDIMVLKMEGHFDKTLLKLFIQKLIGKE